jgi:hypothetical protein
MRADDVAGVAGAAAAATGGAGWGNLGAGALVEQPRLTSNTR